MKAQHRICVALLCSAFLIGFANAGDGPVDQPVRPGVVVFTVFPEHRADLPVEGAASYGRPGIDRFMDQINATLVERTFPHCLPPKPDGADLTTIYTMHFPEKFPVDQVAAGLSKVEGVRYAESWLIYHTVLDHNDPGRNRQYGLDLCEANDAHDISTGDPDAVVAIVDTGVDMDHPDLVDNLWINPGEDLNGNGRIDNDERNDSDDDRNGKVDDFYGWDLINNDNDPDDRDGHGTHTSGIASAVTNNNRGVASVGYSCSIMAVRAGTGGQIQQGYQGIEYATRSGAHVASLSWGGPGENNWTRQVLRYAVDNDVLVIAAAGNDNTNQQFFPAANDDCVAVAATDANDRKAGFSNYGDWVDISAPGVAIYSTIPGGRYANLSGTSMACPFTASVAILLRAAYPFASNAEIRTMLIDGADDIDDVNGNYQGELGSGRINAYESLLLGARPLLTVEDFDIVFDESGNGKLDPAEIADITITVANDDNGTPADFVMVALYSDDPDVEIVENVVEYPALEPGESYTNEDDPFEVQIADAAIAHTTFFTVVLTAEPGGIDMETEVEILIGHPDVLVVDDDSGMEFEEYYYRAVEDMGRGWARWDVQQDFAPGAEILTDYNMTIWVTGDANEPLDGLDRWQIEDGLNGGANILLIGKNIGDEGDDPENRVLLLNSFGARHDQDSVHISSVEGLPGNRPVDSDVRMLMIGGGDAGDGRASPSSMNIFEGNDSFVDSLMIYKRNDEVKGLASVYRYDERTGSKTVYMGFAFEAANEHGFTPKHEILEQIFNWCTSEQVSIETNSQIPIKYSLEPAYPNPFNAQVLLNYALPRSGPHTLSIMNLNGRVVAGLSSGYRNSGTYSVVWNAEGLPSGVYLARLSVPGQVRLERRLILLK